MGDRRQTSCEILDIIKDIAASSGKSLIISRTWAELVRELIKITTRACLLDQNIVGFNFIIIKSF